MNTKQAQQHLHSYLPEYEGNAKPTGMSALLALPLLLAAFTATGVGQCPTGAPAKSEPIPMDQIGAVAGKQYQGDGLSVIAMPEGARLRCVFQKLERQATPEGLWLTSTADASKGQRFRVVASAVGRRDAGDRTSNIQQPTLNIQLEAAGAVAADGQTVRFIRPGLTEEYSVSMDGVQQDFILAERPKGSGQLYVELDVTGATAEPLVSAARLVLDGSGRKIAYSRLRATDAQDKELTATMAVVADRRLAVVVDDADALYPVRIDPTFSDDNWISMGALPGADDLVYAAVADSVGNLYIGGEFNAVGNVFANYVAKWNGGNWSALGSGMGGDYYSSVEALAVAGSDLYVGGYFTTAGGIAATNVAKWNGSGWSALGSGMNGGVSALAVAGNNLYAGGGFTTAGGKLSAYLARAIIGTVGGRFSSPAYSPSTGFSCTFSEATPGEPYRVQASPSLATGSWIDLTNFTYAGPTTITDSSAPGPTNRFYRAVWGP